MTSESIVVNRDEAEGNPFYQQLVSYTLIFNPDKKKVFLGQRLSGENRLVNSYCLGFGGHVNDFDIDPSFKNNVFEITAERELREELNIKKKNLNLNLLGFCRDLNSSTPDHIGAIYLLIAASITVKEKNTLSGKWVSYEDLISNYYHRLDSWSRYSFDHIYEHSKLRKLLNFSE